MVATGKSTYARKIQGFQGFQEETGCTLKYMSSLRTRDGRKPILVGSLSVTTTLPFGSTTDVEKDIERCFHEVGKVGFVLASTSSILPETPMENIETIYRC